MVLGQSITVTSVSLSHCVAPHFIPVKDITFFVDANESGELSFSVHIGSRLMKGKRDKPGEK